MTTPGRIPVIINYWPNGFSFGPVGRALWWADGQRGVAALRPRVVR